MHQRIPREREFGVHQLLACSLGRPRLEVFESVLLFKSSNSNCSLWELEALRNSMKLSANPLVDAVDRRQLHLMAVHSLIMRSAAIFFEQNFWHVEPWCSLLFPFGKLTCKVFVFLCSCVKHPNCLLLISKYSGSRGPCAPHSCTESVIQVEGQRACRLDNQ